MITVKYHVLHPTSGETVNVFDHLVGTEKAVWKIADILPGRRLDGEVSRRASLKRST